MVYADGPLPPRLVPTEATYRVPRAHVHGDAEPVAPCDQIIATVLSETVSAIDNKAFWELATNNIALFVHAWEVRERTRAKGQAFDPDADLKLLYRLERVAEEVVRHRVEHAMNIMDGYAELVQLVVRHDLLDPATSTQDEQLAREFNALHMCAVFALSCLSFASVRDRDVRPFVYELCAHWLQESATNAHVRAQEALELRLEEPEDTDESEDPAVGA